jgi:hypothetical protein
LHRHRTSPSDLSPSHRRPDASLYAYRTVNRTIVLAAVAAIVLAPPIAIAQEPSVYPAKNQYARQQQQQTLNTFNRAYGACMEGRGYTIR